ncbi:HNH endonuclease [Mesorhizobium mediterraneum]|uniref:HNH endonuclease n=1 Tax=Mesorhizobium mediterraneum TaxID=43617 RepID=A0AB36R7C0_9HYPH|nr:MULTISPECIES: HNH endonuclease [Mesorhizobium]PAQ00787.1 HNH endonuclease [Mesorhizobium mediterraneum]RWN40111.1 MAG: HNH endonuclease [Mesorhizobium sp.]RWP02545.1 MAG: HNH endonuclease [Mesorhizobium sp.]TIT26508.1 MAG: HNH endonuclease [Mesorhizobium sp.]TIU15660.1 MAG: HNH endonuclease [Mesorhizobium sp.]
MAERKAIAAATRLRLFSDSAGHCQKPDCLDPLFPVELGGDKHIAEMAHVIPHGEAGPRRQDRPTGDFDPDTFENLILLCPTCHTKIDKDPESFPRHILLEWKQNHVANLAAKQGIRSYEDRAQARAAVAGIMAENKAIWDKFAPEHGSDFEYDPESESAQSWTQRMRSVILPNHYRAQAIIKANLGLATDDERRAFAEYQEHVRGLSERHVCGVAGRAIRFPQAMEGIFT